MQMPLEHRFKKKKKLSPTVSAAGSAYGLLPLTLILPMKTLPREMAVPSGLLIPDIFALPALPILTSLYPFPSTHPLPARMLGQLCQKSPRTYPVSFVLGPHRRGNNPHHHVAGLMSCLSGSQPNCTSSEPPW